MDGIIHYLAVISTSFRQAAASLALLSICVSPASWQLARAPAGPAFGLAPQPPFEWGYKNRRFLYLQL